MDGQAAQLSYTWCKAMEVTSSLFTRVSYINSKSEINWKHVDTIHNPADLGCYVESLADEWWDGPSWQIMKNDLNKGNNSNKRI